MSWHGPKEQIASAEAPFESSVGLHFALRSGTESADLVEATAVVFWF